MPDDVEPEARALADIAALSRAATAAQLKAHALREARDDAIRSAAEGSNVRGLQAEIARAAGLSPSAVRKICGFYEAADFERVIYPDRPSQGDKS